MSTETVNRSQVWIPQSLRQRIESRLANSDFKTVDEYIAYVVEQILDEIEKQDATPEDVTGMSKEDQEVVEQRLRDLGYM